MAKLVASTKAAPVGALITAQAASGHGLTVTVTWGEETSYSLPGGAIGATNSAGIARCIGRQIESSGLYGTSILQKTEVDHWLTFCLGPLSCGAELPAGLVYLDSVLLPATFLVGKAVSIADYCVFGALHQTPCWLWQVEKGEAAPNLLRWYNMMAGRPEVSAALAGLPAASRVKAAPLQDVAKEKKEESAGGKFVDLPGAEMGKVVVRFPPEASGYLHVGHAKAALLNYHYKELFQGRLIMRFDDTNPAKEKEEYEEVILDDMKMLKIKYDHFSRTSDHFETILAYCEKLLHEGKAYVDDTDADTMKAEREAKKESKNRNNTVEKNLALWEEMKKGSAVGTTCAVRAKIDMQSANGCLRDPTIYRCKPEPHPATGTRYKVYPTYDFACPVVDSVEGVTHALRTTEYMDRDDQFMWFIDALGLRKPNIYAYARLNLTNTVMSKRKLTWLVDTGAVEGWDDPRMPTVRGVLRRGLTVEALKQFIIAQGSSRSVVFMEWDKIWAFNKKVIDPIVPRHTTVDKAYHVPVNVAGAVAASNQAARHPKNPAVGEKTVHLGPVVFIDGADAEELKLGENATFINWGNLLIKGVQRGPDGRVTTVQAEENTANKDFKKTLKLTWLCADEARSPFTPVIQVYYDHIISKAILDKDDDFKQFVGKNTKYEMEMLGDPELRNLKKGDIVQIQRRGFFICDSEYEPYNQSVGRAKPVVLISIPDGTPGSYGPPNRKPEVAVAAPAAKTPKGKAEAKKPAGKPAADSPKAKETKTPSPAVSGSSSGEALAGQIQAQGEKVRALKEAKADKAAIGAEVKILLELKASYKAATGKEWQPEAAAAAAKPAASVAVTAAASAGSAGTISDKITSQGDLVRRLKAEKAAKADIDAAVKTLLALKQEYTAATGQEWKPGQPAAAAAAAPPAAAAAAKVAAPAKAKTPPASDSAGAGGDLDTRIAEQGNRVRQLKAEKKDKADIDEAVRLLLEMKASYKATTGKDWVPAGAPVREKKEEKKKEVKPKEKAAPTAGVTRLGMEAKKEENLPDWYSQVLTKAEMMEYYDVSGCYILRPWSFAIWESIKEFFDAEIKKLGVENCYFPCFVSHAALEREKTHIADFAPEVAWVTKSGDSELAEPIAIRPTSETVMYPAYAKWIQSYRDLPLKLNQWNNVVRWEFKHPQPFLRTREFLWQEGHTAFATFNEAKEEVLQILDLYRRVYEELLAIPVIRGRKTEKEKFAGGDYTTTVEAYIAAAGRAIQGATSHHLGQNFSKMFDITFENPETGEKQHVFQNSWGLTTRTIGVLVMVHGDNNGLVLPPRVACLQVVIVPCGVTVNLKKEDRDALYRECEEYRNRLVAAGVRAKADMRENYSPGWKFNHWELKGVPIRVEIGPRDMKENQYVAVRRDSGEKIVMRKCGMEDDIPALLNTIQSALFARARTEMADHVKVATTFQDFLHHLDKNCLIQAPFCGDEACEDEIKDQSKRDADQDAGAPSMGAKSLCIPFNQPAQLAETDRCVRPGCDKKPQYYTLFGRSY